MIKSNLKNLGWYIFEIFACLAINMLLYLLPDGTNPIRIVFNILWLALCFRRGTKINIVKKDLISFCINVILILYIFVIAHIDMVLFVPIAVYLCRILGIIYRNQICFS